MVMSKLQGFVSILVLTTVATMHGPAVAESQTAADSVKPGTNHFALFIGDAKLGYTREIVTISDGIITTRSYTRISMDRFGTPLVVEIKVASQETTDLRPVSIKSTTKVGPITLRDQTVEFSGNTAKLTTIKGGRPTVKNFTVTDKLIATPQATSNYLRNLAVSGQTSGSYTLIEMESETLAETSVEILGREQTRLVDGSHELLRVHQITPCGSMELTTDNWVNDNFEIMRSQAGFMSFRLDIVACDKQYAMAPGRSYKLAEMTLPCPGNLAKKIAALRSPEKAQITFLIKPARGSKIVFPETDLQSVQKNANGTIKLTTSFDPPVTDEAIAYSGSDPEILRYLKATEYVQSDQQSIVEAARKIIGHSTQRYEAAVAIQQWVAENVENVLDVPFNSAVQTLTDKRGDCTEHAVLAAALCRAAKIPARVISGVVYAENFGNIRNTFIGHAWCQVYVDGKWRRVDAAYTPSSPRITCSVGNGDPMEMVSIVDAVKMRILSVKVADRNR